MKPADARVLFGLLFGCCLMAVGYGAAGTCCGITASSPYLSYNLARGSSVPTFYGNAGVAYKSTCNDCITASFLLATVKNCTFKGTLPAITAYTCQYYLSSVNEFTAVKQKRDKLPCSYNTNINKNINDTHYQSCFGSYVGIAVAEFDVSKPGGVAKVECKSLVGGPQNCDIYTSSG